MIKIAITVGRFKLWIELKVWFVLLVISIIGIIAAS